MFRCLPHLPGGELPQAVVLYPTQVVWLHLEKVVESWETGPPDEFLPVRPRLQADELPEEAVVLYPARLVWLRLEKVVESWETGPPDALLPVRPRLRADEMPEEAVVSCPAAPVELQRPLEYLVPKSRLLLSQVRPQSALCSALCPPA